MSIQFSDTSTYKGLVQLYEIETGRNIGDVSGSSDKLKEFTALANLALDDYKLVAIRSGGTWQDDDLNFTGEFPIIRTNLVANQRDYSFLRDEDNNLVLDIHRVFVKADSDGSYEEIYPIDQQSDLGTEGFTDGRNSTGSPYWYDKTGNTISLDPIPSESVSSGLKVMINREGSYFTTSDTTKIPGVPVCHQYFFLHPAREFARRNRLASLKDLENKVKEVEYLISEYYSNRERDKRKIMSAKAFNYR